MRLYESRPKDVDMYRYPFTADPENKVTLITETDGDGRFSLYLSGHDPMFQISEMCKGIIFSLYVMGEMIEYNEIQDSGYVTLTHDGTIVVTMEEDIMRVKVDMTLGVKT